MRDKMISTLDMINLINKNLKIKPLDFGFVGEIYSKQNYYNEQQAEVISKYIFMYQNICVNRKTIYYSSSFSDALDIIEQAHDDYCLIHQSQLDVDFKRYALFSIIEYVMHSICKLLNLCFENKVFRAKFYADLKNQLENYTDIIVELMFSEILTDIQIVRNDLYNEIKNFFLHGNTPSLREHVEYDHKLLLLYAYILYFDIIDVDSLLICPLLGAAQIPPFFNSIEKYFNESFYRNRAITYDYVKYSTYDITDFLSLDEQSAELIKIHGEYSNVILLDESLGTGNTLLEIKKTLKNYFNDIKIGSVEFRWDKKIIWNNDREWFDINHIDYITPISYRHYLVLLPQIDCLKKNVVSPLPYIPFMIFDDYNFEYYMSKQKISNGKKKVIDSFFYKSKLIKEVFYSTV